MGVFLGEYKLTKYIYIYMKIAILNQNILYAYTYVQAYYIGR